MAKSLKLSIHGLDGVETSTTTLDERVFGVAVNPALVSEVTVSSEANRRHPVAHTLTRGNVRGGGRKPWRQKGTGRARAGSTRSPIWRHGGTAFGPLNDRNFFRKINRKARIAAMRMILSALVEDQNVYLIDALKSEKLATTKQAATLLNTAAPKAVRPMLLTASADATILRAGRNLNGLMIRSLERLGFLDLMRADRLILDTAALTALTARMGGEAPVAPVATPAATEKKPAAKRARKVTNA